ncbi:Cytochrome C oxidase, cbb3-type, subunit III [Shimia aestuarii]|uniref:Cytochrome C oxidase, cbb3-type, subunit III n=2 Tax=Shimia aestuarii TaxID=254406 RepID=A0A1I4RL57_9RHOB|nr:Cytochrome C oxidase, cbb3-type, subunit III [Shimia aestuarii]
MGNNAMRAGLTGWITALGLPLLVVACGINVAQGRGVYERNCVQCHGDTGLGDGPFADKLLKPPTDLTVLARNNGGTFPAMYVTEIIDGHSRSEDFSGAMPEFGPGLGGEELQLGPLVDYLETLQR